MDHYEVCWQEFNASGRLVTKRKSFKTERAFNKFVEKLFKKDSFYKIFAYR